MKRFRLGTLMLVVVIAALLMGLVVQQHRASLRDAAQQAEIASLRAENAKLTMGMDHAYLAEYYARFYVTREAGDR